MDRHVPDCRPRALTAGLLLALVGGCSEYEPKLHEPPEDEPLLGALVVEPMELDFGDVPSGQTDAAAVQFSNLGEAPITVTALGVLQSSAFEVDAPDAPWTLEPGEVQNLIVTFTAGDGPAEGVLYAETNDVELSQVEVALRGDAPHAELVVAPSPLDFGYVGLACVSTAHATLTNAGTIDLTVDGIEAVGEGYRLVDPPGALVLPPGATHEVTVELAATADGEQLGDLVVYNSGVVGISSTPLVGMAVASGEVEEAFVQPDGPWAGVDLMLVIDQSNSMSDSIESLIANVEVLTSALLANADDFRVAVVTEDSGCATGGVLTPDSPQLAEQIAAAAWTGDAGNDEERGLDRALEALSRTDGACNDGFLTPDAKVAVVIISDEEDQSATPWYDAVDEARAIAPTLSFHAVAGPLPDGCLGAGPGTGYAEAVDATDGLFVSICDAWWAEVFDDLVRTSLTGPTDTFPLDGVPDPTTLVVTLDGALATGWAYDAGANAVVFTAQPDPGVEVRIRYTLDSSCG